MIKRKSRFIAPALAFVLCTNLNAEQLYTVEDKSLIQAIEQISQKANIPYMVDAKLLEGKTAPNIKDVEGVQKALDKVLEGTKLKAIIEDGTILIRKKELNNSSNNGNDLGSVEILANSSTTEGTGSYTIGSTSTATKMNLSLRETPQTLSVMTRDRIEDQSLSSVTEILEQTPGIYVEYLDSERATFSSRTYNINGYQYDGVNTYESTVTLNTPQALADTATIDHVEVLRGATGLMTGAGDPGGSINIIRKKPTSDFKGHILGGIGNYNFYRGEIDVSGALSSDKSLRGRLIASQQSNESSLDRYEKNRSTLYGVLEYDFTDNTLFTVGLDYQNNKTDNATFSGNPAVYSDGTQAYFPRSFNNASIYNKYDQETYNYFTSLEHNINEEWKLKLSGNYIDGKRDYSGITASRIATGGLDKETGDGVLLTGLVKQEGIHEQKGIDINLTGGIEVFDMKTDIILGTTYSSYHSQSNNWDSPNFTSGTPININDWDGSINPEPLVGNPDGFYLWEYTQKGVYSALRIKPTNNLSLIAGVRLSDYDYYREYSKSNRITDYDESNVITPYAGIVYDINNLHSTYVSYTSIFNPNGELQDRDGNSLDPIEGNNYEVGLKSEFFDGLLNTSISLFMIKQENYPQADSGYIVPGTESTTAYRTVDGAKTKGLDLEIIGKISDNWEMSASYSYSKTKDQDDVRIETNIPQHLFKFWNTYNFQGNLNGLTVGGGFNWYSKKYLEDYVWYLGTDAKIEEDSYAIFNAMAKYKINPDLTLSLKANNLFDKEYLGTLSLTNGNAYGASRQVKLELKYTF